MLPGAIESETLPGATESKFATTLESQILSGVAKSDLLPGALELRVAAGAAESDLLPGPIESQHQCSSQRVQSE